MGITYFTAPIQCFQVFYMCTFQRCCARFRDVVHVSEMLCTCQRCCARFRDVVHVSEMLCTCQRCYARVRDVVHVSEMLCMFQRCCARIRDVVHVSQQLSRFTEVVHVSQKLCTSHTPPKNVRVQLYTHWAHSNQRKHWGDQTRSPDIYIHTLYTCILYKYVQCVYVYTYNDSFAVMYNSSKIVMIRMRTIKHIMTVVTIADTYKHNKRPIHMYALQCNAM